MTITFQLFSVVLGCTEPESTPVDPKQLFTDCTDGQDDAACLKLSETPGKLNYTTRRMFGLSILCKRDALNGCQRLYDLRNEPGEQAEVHLGLGGNCGKGVEAACVYTLKWADEDPSILNENARALTEAKLAEIRAAK